MIDDVKLRPMDDNDIVSVYDIENSGYEDVSHWGEIDIYQRLIGKENVTVAIFEGVVVGFMGYAFSDEKSILLRKLVVEKLFRRKGIATKLLDSIKKYLIEVEIAERNLDAQLFLKESGFKCNKIIKDTNGILKTDVYVFSRPSKRFSMFK